MHSEKRNMICVEAGTFQMGDTFGDGNDEEKPVHEVKLDTFYICKYPVTQKLYEKIMGYNPSYFDGKNNPVEQVTWYDAVEFCNKLSKRDGLEPCYEGSRKNIECDFSAKGYRLPTEAEWEYAAKGGKKSKGYKYAGSNNIDGVSWYSDPSDDRTHPVGQNQPNELGIYDMSGNVWEWCWDWYDEDYYSNSPKDNPTGPSSGSNRVLRGGIWYHYTNNCRDAYRHDNNPMYGSGNSYGFRFLRTE